MVDDIATQLINCFNRGNFLFIVGCGGSATMSSHFAGELVAKFEKERGALPALSLTDNNAVITAIANDYSFNDVYARQLEAYGRKGDVLITLSTSGKSKSILKAIKKAKELGIIHIPLPTNKQTGLSTADTQEVHLGMIHNICRKIESSFIEV